MTWTYSNTLENSRDKIRFLIGDTDTTDQQVSDEEITGSLAMNGSDVYQTAIAICRALSAKYSRAVDTSIDGYSVSASQLATHYQNLAGVIEAQSANAPGALGVPVLGGTSISGMDTRDANTDRPPSRARVGMDEAPGVSPPYSNNLSVED